jgi:hypothetical protein
MDSIVKILSRFVLRDLIPETIKYTTPVMGRITNKRPDKAPHGVRNNKIFSAVYRKRFSSIAVIQPG